MTNAGNVDLTGLQLTDDHVTGPITLQNTSSGDPVTSLSPGYNATGTATYQIKQLDLDNGSVTNTATVKCTQLGPETAQATVNLEHSTHGRESGPNYGGYGCYGGAFVPVPMVLAVNHVGMAVNLLAHQKYQILTLIAVRLRFLRLKVPRLL